VTAFETAWNSRFGVRRPERIVCVGRNYAAHADEEGVDLPSAPLLFAKLANTVVGPGEPIVLPAGSSHVDAEAELALVIGRQARRVTPERAAEVLAGYTAANDVSARDFQYADGQWFRGKGYDSFCPIQPEVASLETLEPALDVHQILNGALMQEGNTRDLIFGIAALEDLVHAVWAYIPNVLAALLIFYVIRVHGRFCGPVPQATSREALLKIEAELEKGA